MHWTSGIEAGIRLISWTWIRRLLDDWPKVGDLFEHNDDAVRQIAWHQEFLAAFPSRGSSANNHVLAEAAGRLVAACAFPWYARTDRWRRSAAALLERELAANTFDDGLNRELATDYHRFVLELGLVAAVEADAHGHALSEVDLGALGADARCRRRHPGRRPAGRRGRVTATRGAPSWSTTRSATRGLPSWAPAPHCWAHQTGGRLSPAGSRRASRRSWAVPSSCRDRRSGHVGSTMRAWSSLRSRAQDGPEIWCRCDGGPHGFLSIAAHAHADALSVEVRHDGVDILADPGTYCYHGEPEWREWFRSTAAHNTVEIGGVSQSESGGPFLWNTQARTTTLTCDVGEQPVQTWCAEHDGYLRLNTPTIHRRSVTLDSPERRLMVIDTFDATAAFPFEHVVAPGPGRLGRPGRSARNAVPGGSGQNEGRECSSLDPKDWLGPCHQAEVDTDRRLVFAALRHSRSGDLPSRTWDGHALDPSHHRTGAAMSYQVTTFRSTSATLRRRSRAARCSGPCGSGCGRCVRVGGTDRR